MNVELTNPTDQGRLVPTYLAERDTLIVATAQLQRTTSAYQVKVGNSLLLDFDAQRTLISVEVLISKRFWAVGELAWPAPPTVTKANVTLPHSAKKQQFFREPVEVLTDPVGARVLIKFGPLKGDLQAADLGPGCTALLLGKSLVGFAVTME